MPKKTDSIKKSNIGDKLVIEEKKLKKDSIDLTLDGEVSIYTIKELSDLMKDRFRDYSYININLTKVNRFDTAGFQLFLILINESEKRNIKLSMTKPGSEIKDIFDLGGIKYKFKEK